MDGTLLKPSMYFNFVVLFVVHAASTITRLNVIFFYRHSPQIQAEIQKRNKKDGTKKDHQTQVP